MSLENITDNNDFEENPGEYLINYIPTGLGFLCFGPFVILMYTTPDEERKNPYTQSMIQLLICRSHTNFNLFPITYTISHWKRLRDMMSCCKCCKNRVYVENLATTLPG
ncbi:unnamed protein product [Caenorhabditis angaria]|uniref:Uncharacterized protein n=1 Tax=Caenorhabditis angaria TaxID=860376 RepID=A0A9P1N9T4_9PELO|nr:unnamed protein product [Caenorhabditis angaria]